MSKSSKSRRSDDEFKPPSAKKSKQQQQQVKPEEHQSVQRIRLLDLIKCNYLCAGDEVFVKDQEGIITDRGTIKVLTNTGLDSKEIEYSNPTSWTKQVTGRENGGWGQIRLKGSKQTLASIKEQYQKNVSTMEFMDDSGELQKPLPYSSELNTSTNSPPTDTPPSDLTLPLKVRFINDEDRVFKIMYVSPDFTEFHTEYQGTLYTNLADFVSKIFEDFQKPTGDSNSPPGNLRFDELMYELSPGRWVRLAGNLFPSDLMAQQGSRQNAEGTYQQNMGQPILPLTFSNTTPTGDNCNHKTNNNNSCNNSEAVDTHMGSDVPNANNSSYDEYSIADDDDDDDEFYQNNEQRRRRNSLNKNRPNNKRPAHCYMSLVFVEDSAFPLRVNSFGPTTVKDVLHTVFTESNLKFNTASEADLLRDYHVEIEDYDFGGVKILFPRSIASFPIKSKIFIRRKENQEVDSVGDNSLGMDKEHSTDHILNDKHSHPIVKDEDV